jgi:hypothetical protein
LYTDVFKLDKPCDLRLVKWYKNLDSEEGQYLSPFQARAKWVLFKQRWIPDNDKEPDNDTVKKIFPVKDYNRMEKLCKDMDNARSMMRISNPRVV